MASIREQITEALITALNTDTPAGVPQCERSRGFATDTSVLPVMLFYPIHEEVQKVGPIGIGPVAKRSLNIRIDIRAESPAEGEPIDKVLDPMISWVSKALVNNKLNGLVHDIAETGIDWQIEMSDQQYGIATVDLVVQYQTLSNNAERTK